MSDRRHPDEERELDGCINAGIEWLFAGPKVDAERFKTAFTMILGGSHAIQSRYYNTGLGHRGKFSGKA